MVVEVIRVDLVAQKETLNLTEMLSFKKQEKEKELAKKVAPSSQSIGSVKGSAQNYVDYCLFFYPECGTYKYVHFSFNYEKTLISSCFENQC